MSSFTSTQPFFRNPPVNRPQERSFQNLSGVEQAIGVAVGAALIGFGITRRTAPAMVLSIGAGAAALTMGAAGYCPVHHMLGINNARKGTAEPVDFYEEGIRVETRYTIARPAEELFTFWRNFENLPKFMNHLKSVTCSGGNRSHWVASGPAGMEVQWDAEIINEEPNRLIAWRTVGEGDVDSTGTVRFLPAPGERGTEVHVNLNYIPPAGKMGAALAKMFGDDPKTMIEEDLRRFKQLIETGEVATIAGQSSGSCR
jgi:uncharacterized membrane protein